MAKGKWHINADKVALLALDQNMTERELLEMANLCPIILSEARRGKAAYASTVNKIADVLGVFPSEIIKETI